MPRFCASSTMEAVLDRSDLFADLAQFLDVLFEFCVSFTLHERPADAHCRPTGIAARRLLDVGVHDVVDTVGAGLAGAAEAYLHTCQHLQFEGDVLDDVAHPGALGHPLHERTLAALGTLVLHQGGHQGNEPVVETGDEVGRQFLQLFEVELHDDELVPADAPVVGASQGPRLQNSHR